MATARPFAYNTGSPIAGTQQVGNLAVGTPTAGFESTGLKWWNGPDEEVGYVITHQSPSGQPGGDGTTAFLGFWRTNSISDAEFIQLAQYVSDYTQTFSTASDAKTWLNANGYWTSWEPPQNGQLIRAVGAFPTVTGSTIVTFSSTTFSISGSSYLPVYDGETREFSHGDIEIGDSFTIGVTGTPVYTVAVTKNTLTFFQSTYWYIPETGITINTAVSTADTFSVSVGVRVYEYTNPGTGSSAIQACSSYPTLTSSKYSVLPWGSWAPGTVYIYNDSQYTSPFTSAYVANLDSVSGTIVMWKETDSSGKVINQGNCP